MGFSLKTIGDTISDPVMVLPQGLKEFVPGIGDAIAQEKANEINLEEAQKNRNFQERLSNSAYQRAVADMKKAGINPMLAFSQGGASVPSGSVSQAQTAAKTGLVNTAISAATGYNAARQQQQALDNQQAQTVSNINLQNTQSAKNLADTEATRVRTQIERKELPLAKLKEKATGKATEWLNKVLEMGGNSAKRPYQSDALIKVPAQGKKEEKPSNNHPVIKWLRGEK